MIKTISRDLKVRLLTFVAIFSWTCYQTITHEMWRDEAHSWLIARSAPSPSDIFVLTQYEGRQPLWYLILWLFTQFSTNFEAAKILIILFTLGSFLLLIFFAKIDLKILILILPGFLFTGGYTTLLRDYAIELFLVSLFITFKRLGVQKYLVLLVVGILAWINAFGLVLAISILAAEIFSISKTVKIKNNLINFMFLIFTVFSITISAYFIKPSSDNSFQLNTQLNIFENFSALYYKITVSFFPFIEPTGARNPIFITFALVSTAILVAFFYVNWKVEKYIFWFATTGVSLFSLNYMFGYAYYWWHFGNLFFVFLISALITKHKDNFNVFLKIRNIIFLILFISQVISNFGYPGNTLFTNKPYSNAKEAADLIAPMCSENCSIITDNLYATETVSAYLGGIPIFNAKTNSFEKFSIWKTTNEPDADWNLIIDQARKFENPIIIINELNNPPEKLILLGDFNDAIWADERFAVYTLR